MRPAAVRQFHRTSGSDQILKLFDSQKYFANFILAQYLVFSTANVGLFKNKHLASPEGLIRFSEQLLQKAKTLVKTMLLEAQTDQGKLTFIRKLDQLSDTLCRVIDVAEFIRVAHPSQKWVEAAQNTHEIMFEYMNQLNTDVRLHSTLSAILDDKYIIQSLSNEEIEVGKYLRQDFERSGIAMDPQTRDNFVSITQQISLLGSQFSNEMQNLESFWLSVPESEFRQISLAELKSEIYLLQAKSSLQSNFLQKSVSIPLAGHIPGTILAKCSVESIRKKVWVALHNSVHSQLHTLESFLKYRALLSNMLGYKSYAAYQLEFKMAKSPENVLAFLENLQRNLLSDGSVVNEIKELYKHKPGYNAAASDREILRSVKPWDRDYLSSLNERSSPSTDGPGLDLSPYLSVGTIMSGLDKLFRSLYNVALIPEKTEKGETWDQNRVRKLSYRDLSTNETLGYLYVDFWSPKVLPSHFTIVCSREINNELGSESGEDLADEVHVNAAKDYQLPVISLVCNFHDNRKSKFKGWAEEETPTLLSLEQVDTIFHEMGHATHSMLGRTKLHNLSGTRCLTDFVELPSVLMELFSSDPRVLCKIARHYSTGEQLPESLLRAHRKRCGSLEKTETYMQSKMAMLDQALHGEIVDFAAKASLETFDSTHVYHDLERKLQVFADEYSTWHGKFPHLFSYGAVYYSYLLDRAIAEKLWKGLFQPDPWSRSAGEKYRNSILKWGGTKDPWQCLSEALDMPELSKGDSKAMSIIGNA